MGFRNSPSQPEKKIPGPKNHDFNTQYRWSRWVVVANSCLPTGILSHQPLTILAEHSLKSCANQIFPTFLPMILKKLTRVKNGAVKCGYVWYENSYIYSTVMWLSYLLFHWQCWKGTKNEQPSVDACGIISHIYILQLCIWLIFRLIDRVDKA